MEEADVRDLVAAAMRWRAGDPDPTSRAELESMIGQVISAEGAPREAALRELSERFAGDLQFGTAGLRGPLGAGPNRMNRAVVIRTAAALAAYLRAVLPPDGEPPVVVVGYDARHRSDVFARDTCAVLTAAGCQAVLLPRTTPTPVLAFAVRRLPADAGVMVTASHNPATDNGYKVYLGARAVRPDAQGAQIVPPHDERIAALLTTAPTALDVPVSTTGWQLGEADIARDYLAAVTALVDPQLAGPVPVVLTPLHGVGGELAEEAFRRAGFGSPHLVAQQREPDPDFPTVAFPNPEEPGALDLAIEAARARRAQLVIALDPDADRCAVAVPEHRTAADTTWRRLHGDEVGALLGEHLLRRPGRQRHTVASSIVSAGLLAKIAQEHGARHVQTLTGFKWLARVPDLLFAYEEALGYCVAPDLVRDKDGISAALLITELAVQLRREGRTLLDALDDLARRHGLHATDQLTVPMADPRQADVIVAALRHHPPTELAGSPVTSLEDLAEPQDDLPATTGCRLRTADGARVILRPSGTEPKLKCYLEVVQTVQLGARGPALARASAQRRLQALRRDLTSALPLPQVAHNTETDPADNR